MKKQLSDLIASIDTIGITGNIDIPILGVSEKSQEIKKGFLFVAIRGVSVDAHHFIPQAIAHGACAIVGEEDPAHLMLSGIPYIRVAESRKALGIIAANWYDNPSHKLTVIGITGTDGKTTTTTLLYSILRHARKQVSMISTVNARIHGRVYETGLHTTNPDALPLQRLLALMVEKKQEIAILETTSEGIAQERVAGVAYQIGILTNITPEHLNYHKTFENYRATKARLFENTMVNILNADDPSFSFIQTKTHPQSTLISYGLSQRADLFADDIQEMRHGMRFSIHEKGQTYPMKTRLHGHYNVHNILAASAAARSLGVSWETIQEAIAHFVGIAGRMEVMQQKPFRIIVDFAHTPHALTQVLSTVKSTTKGNVIVVFGCAGQRDTHKRPEMARTATLIADHVIFTIEDPRTEPVAEIFTQMTAGVEQRKNYEIIEDRGEAITEAIHKAKPGDTVIICGKGHEKSLAYQGREYPWSDQEAVNRVLHGEHVRVPWAQK